MAPAVKDEDEDSYRPRSPDLGGYRPRSPDLSFMQQQHSSSPQVSYQPPLPQSSSYAYNYQPPTTSWTPTYTPQHRSSYDASPFFNSGASQPQSPPFSHHHLDQSPESMPPRRSRKVKEEFVEPVVHDEYASKILVKSEGPGPSMGIDVKTKFPVARIKRIMQADEDVGKVAQVTPIAVSKALELFMISLVTKSAEEAKSRNSKRITATHLKQAVEKDERLDFLAEIISKIPDAAAAGTKREDEDAAEPEEPKRRRGGGRKKRDDD